MERLPLECPRCLNRYEEPNRIPYVISCGHTFCDVCRREIDRCTICQSHRLIEDRINYFALDILRSVPIQDPPAEINPQRYDQLWNAVNMHDACLDMIDIRLGIFQRVLNQHFQRSERHIRTRIKELDNLLLRNLQETKEEIKGTILNHIEEFKRLRTHVDRFRQNQAIGEDLPAFTAERALDYFNMKELPIIKTQLNYELSREIRDDLRAKLYELILELRNSNREVEISTRKVGEDRYVVTINGEEFKYGVQDGLLTLLEEQLDQQVNPLPNNLPQVADQNRPIHDIINPNPVVLQEDQNPDHIRQNFIRNNLRQNAINPLEDQNIHFLAPIVEEHKFPGHNRQDFIPRQNAIIPLEDQYNQFQLPEDSLEEISSDEVVELQDFIEEDNAYRAIHEDDEWVPSSNNESISSSSEEDLNPSSSPDVNENIRSPIRIRRLRQEEDSPSSSAQKRFRPS